MSKILVTTYVNPDLDGCACMIAYAELLRKQGKDAVAGYFGEPQQDAKFVFERFGAALPEKISGSEHEEVVLVDVSNPQRLDQSIDPSKVVEIIDHHEPHAEAFPNANLQIEHLGAAATLVTERLRRAESFPSPELVKVLQMAIVHGTLNFKANLSTEKDRDMYEWLSSVSPLSQEDIDEFFRMITTFPEPLLDFLRDDFKDFDISGIKFGIASILIFDLTEFLGRYKGQVLEALETLKQEKTLEHIWFSSIDLKDGTSYFLVPDENTQKLAAEGLGLEFNNGEAKVNEMILRKEQLKQITGFLNKNK